MEQVIDLLKIEANQYKIIKVNEIVFDESIRKYCQANTCGLYNKSWVCSENNRKIFDLDRVKSFDKVLIFNQIYKLEDSFDYESMVTSGKEFTLLIRKVVGMLNQLQIVHVPFGLGGCDLCVECEFPKKACKYPSQLIYPVESIDIMVSKTATNNGFKYINGINTVTYFSMVFIKDDKNHV